MRRLVIGITLMMSLVPHWLRAQPGESFVVETIGLRQGLPTADIHTIYRDRSGFLWLGTGIGLVRYDGYGFETISVSQEGRWLGLVNAITEDDSGTLWVGTDDGLFRVHQHRAYAISSLQTGRYVRMTALLFDPQQNLWCATSSGAYRISRSDLQNVVAHSAAPVRAMPLPGYEQLVPETRRQPLFTLAFDEKGNLYAGGFTGLFRYEAAPGSGKAPKPVVRLWPKVGKQVEIQALAVRSSNDLVFTTYDPLGYIRLRNGKEERYFPGIYSTDVVYQQQYWYLSYGLYRQRPSERQPVSLVNLYRQFSGSYTKLYIDREGIFWVATNEGLIKIRASLYKAIPLPSTISGSEINGLGVYNNQLLVGAHRGRVFGWTGDTLRQLFDRLVPIAGVSALRQDRRQTLWLATTYQGLLSFDGNQIRRYTAADGLVDKAFNDLVPGRSNGMWAVGETGITRIGYDSSANDPSAHRYRLQFYRHQTNRYKATIFYSGIEAPDGRLWLASDYGLVSFRAGRFTNHRLTIGTSTVRSVRKMATDKRGNVWLATEGHGLLYGKFIANRFRLIRSYTTGDGLPSNTFSEVLVDSRGRIWAGGSTALSCLEPTTSTLRICNFDYKDGFFGESFQNIKLIEFPANMLWIGSTEGLLRVSTASFKPAQTPFASQITDVRLRDENDDIQRYSLAKDARTGLPLDCQLPASKNALTFTFAQPSLLNPTYNRYRFRLDGSGENWRTTSGSDRSVTYAGLKPGLYTFRMAGASASGVWNAPTSFTFEILPPVWQRGWFIALALTLAGLGIWGFIRYRERRVKAREMEKNRLAQLIADLETKAIRAQMNPHFIFNCLNSIQECILADNTDAAYRYLSKFSRLLRMVLEESARNFHSLQQELDLIRLYLELESLRFEQPLHSTIDVAPGVDAANWQVPSLLLQPLVENAIWHGLIHLSGERQLRLSIEQDTPTTLTCTITDNGVGRARATELAAQKLVTRTTKGIALVAERLSLLEPAGHEPGTLEIDDLVDTDGQPLGTCVRVRLPILTPLAVRTNTLTPPAHVSRLSH